MRLILCLWATVILAARAATPPPVWESSPAISRDGLAAALAKLDADSAGLPPSLARTVSFQRLLLRIRAGAQVADWRQTMNEYAAVKDDAPVANGLRDLAKAWEARARMAEVDSALRQHYRKNVAFPAKLDEIKAQLPATAQTDPWGGPWLYAPTAPKGFSAKFASQRYTLGSARQPTIRSLEATLAEPGPAKTWKITPKEVAGQRILEIRTAGGQTVATQAGGHVEDATVLYIGDGWALCSDLERLFTIQW